MRFLQHWPSEIKNDEKIFILPTDSIYGIHASALDKSAVEYLRELKKRPKDKAFIVLLSSKEELESFVDTLPERISKLLDLLWPGKVSVVIESKSEFSYLSPSGKVAFRVPEKKELRDFLRISGPLVSSSANLSGESPAKSAREAKEIFKDSVDIYVDEGELISEPSTLIEILR